MLTSFGRCFRTLRLCFPTAAAMAALAIGAADVTSARAEEPAAAPAADTVKVDTPAAPPEDVALLREIRDALVKK